MTGTTKAQLEQRCDNINRRMESRGSDYRYHVEYRNGSVAIDRYHADGAMDDTVRAGLTKTEAGELLHVMMVVLDDSARSDRGTRRLAAAIWDDAARDDAARNRGDSL